MGRHPQHYWQLWRHTLTRLLLTYLAPLLLLTVYFHWQYRSLAQESRQRHLLSIAESQARTVDLFLRERLANLSRVIDDPQLGSALSKEETAARLAALRKASPTFVDVGFFDAMGTMLSYAGPFPSLLARGYGAEEWFTGLLASDLRFVVTDMYLGFRQRPHFTIAVRRSSPGEPVAIRATLDPERFSDYIATLKGSKDVQALLVNSTGRPQTVSLPGALSRVSPMLRLPREPNPGMQTIRRGSSSLDLAYCWLELTDWALISLSSEGNQSRILAGLNPSLVALSSAVVFAVFSTILIRAGQVVSQQQAEDEARRDLSGQLHHAARLASIGELAAGVAHEINNPLAIIAEEAGLMKDTMDTEHGGVLDREDLAARIAVIHEAVFRIRDITRQLLSFVRKTDVSLELHDVNRLVEDVVAGLLEREMSVANIEIRRDYESDLPRLLADRGQIEQVILNLVTNAIGAMPRGGRLTLTTSSPGPTIRIAVADTGSGIAAEELDRIFMPFYTTKEVGRGTGLGLSVSLGIVKGYGGQILVDSALGAGSVFTVVLPVEPTPNHEDTREEAECTSVS